MVDGLGEARLSRFGLALLATGLVLMAVTRSYAILAASLTLMPLGTAFLFPCITGLLSHVVSARERGLYMGVQHTFGGFSRVAFPMAAGLAMHHLGLGVPFVTAGLMVVATLPLTSAMASYLTPPARPAPAAERLSAADITAELPLPPDE